MLDSWSELIWLDECGLATWDYFISDAEIEVTVPKKWIP